MYGLVHVGLRDYIIVSHGELAWQHVLRKSTLDQDAFVLMQSYPDAVSYQLVGAAISELNLSLEQLLDGFGRHWVLHTGPETYGSLLDMSGDSVPELLASLDDLHVHLAHVMPDLMPPSFQCEQVTDHSLLLHYRSRRQGLDAMVCGLVKGMGERFGTPCDISLVSSEHSDDQVHSVFAVSWHAE